jgi:hypothetical protein
MKFCKHYLLFALAGAVLLFPITSQYALDINWWKEKISQYQETLQKTMPGALVALGITGGALYYWWTRKKGGDDSGKGGENLIPEGLLKTPILKQLKVYSHFVDNGQGVASTGYHTLLRAMQVVQAKSENESDEDLQETVESPDLINKYFGSDGIWRQAIMRRREFDDKGDWLDNEELLYLWYSSFDIVPKDVECYLFAIPNFDVLGNDFSALEFYINENVRPVLYKKEQIFIIFALGTMDTTEEKERIHIRWYPLVMYQNKKGERKYYIMDSYDNIDRTKRENVKKMIELLEQ